MTKGALVTRFALPLFVMLALLGAPGCCMGRHHPQGSTETLTISGPGFAPDPMTTSGQAGGTLSASTLATGDVNGNCAGQIPQMPQHMLRVGAALPLLRVLVNGSGDSTLLVRAPDGTIYCNDDSGDPNNGLNPLVEITNAPPGDYAIYVGAFSESSMLSTYAIGFTATPGTFPSQVVR
jgi:hypothetical protein